MSKWENRDAKKQRKGTVKQLNKAFSKKTGKKKASKRPRINEEGED